MKISCNVIEDLLPLYIDDMVSEDSRQLVEEHLKECQSCQRTLEEMKKENQLTSTNENAQRRETEMEPLKKIRRKIRRKRIAAVLTAVVLAVAAGGIGHYWYYDRETYISWEDAGITVRDGKIYSGINPTGRLKAVVSVDQKNMFYMMSETAWTRKEYPADTGAENELWDIKDLQEAHDRGVNAVTDETSMPSGVENIYYVDPENIQEAFKLWDYQEDPQEAQKKEEELAAKCHLIWSAEETENTEK